MLRIKFATEKSALKIRFIDRIAKVVSKMCSYAATAFGLSRYAMKHSERRKAQ